MTRILKNLSQREVVAIGQQHESFDNLLATVFRIPLQRQLQAAHHVDAHHARVATVVAILNRSQVLAQQMGQLGQRLPGHVAVGLQRVFHGRDQRGDQLVFPQPDSRTTGVDAHREIVAQDGLAQGGRHASRMLGDDAPAARFHALQPAHHFPVPRRTAAHEERLQRGLANPRIGRIQRGNKDPDSRFVLGAGQQSERGLQPFHHAVWNLPSFDAPPAQGADIARAPHEAVADECLPSST